MDPCCFVAYCAVGVCAYVGPNEVFLMASHVHGKFKLEYLCDLVVQCM